MRYQPRLLSITHIPTNSGLVQPADAIAKIFKDHVDRYSAEAWYILDACQSAGQKKLDTEKLGCDFLRITCRKFLRGPRGTGALYISDRALEGGPGTDVYRHAGSGVDRKGPGPFNSRMPGGMRIGNLPIRLWWVPKQQSNTACVLEKTGSSSG